jgi:membrane protein YdbS with pleckstrin-like domain
MPAPRRSTPVRLDDPTSSAAAGATRPWARGLADAGDPARLGGWAVPGGPARAAGEPEGAAGGSGRSGSPGGSGGPGSEAPSDEDGGRRNLHTGGRPRDTRSEPAAEEKICVVHPAMFRAHPGRYMLIVLLFVGGIAALLTGVIKKDQYEWLVFVGTPATLAGMIWWIWWWFFSTICVKLTITNKRSIRQEGFIRRSSTEVLHDHVRSVDITQGFVQRVLNVGYIGIDSAGQDGIEIEIADIPRPYDVKAIIDRYRRM